MDARCHSLCCDKPVMKKGGGRYCRAHRDCAIADAFGEALRVQIAALPNAKPAATYLNVGDVSHGWSFALETRAGRLTVSFHDGDYALFSRFEDPHAGNRLLGGRLLLGDEVNPYSGKWNHHISDGHPVESAVLFIMNQLKRVLEE
jgi:hypothetical protein